eukprot:scaffold282276_cov27-Tisochrysis_lutea.AAC.2
MAGGIHADHFSQRPISCLAPDASEALNSGALAAATEGFSGAELAGLVRAASSFALERYASNKGLTGLMAPPEEKMRRRSTAKADNTEEAKMHAAMLEVNLQDVSVNIPLLIALHAPRPCTLAATSTPFS